MSATTLHVTLLSLILLCMDNARVLQHRSRVQGLVVGPFSHVASLLSCVVSLAFEQLSPAHKLHIHNARTWYKYIFWFLSLAPYKSKRVGEWIFDSLPHLLPQLGHVLHCWKLIKYWTALSIGHKLSMEKSQAFSVPAMPSQSWQKMLLHQGRVELVDSGWRPMLQHVHVHLIIKTLIARYVCACMHACTNRSSYIIIIWHETMRHCAKK